MTGPDGFVFAFECEPFIYAVLLKNLAVNDINNAKPSAWVLWSESGHVGLPSLDESLRKYRGYGCYAIDPKGRGTPTSTIDAVLAELTIPISFMKVDCQGSDLHVMMGARETIKRWQMPIVFEYEPALDDLFETSWGSYARFVDAIGYRIVSEVGNQYNYLIEPR
jgi:FkbM family methyltransferase